AEKSAQDGGRPPHQRLFVRDDDKVFGSLWAFRRVQQIGLRRKGQPLQIVQRADRVGIQPMFAEKLAVMGGERQDDSAQVTPKLFGLQSAHHAFRQLLPSFL